MWKEMQSIGNKLRKVLCLGTVNNLMGSVFGTRFHDMIEAR